MDDFRRRIDAVQDHVRDAQQVWQGLLFHTSDRGLQQRLIVMVADGLALVIDGAGQEAAGPAGGVEHHLIKPGIQPIDNEFRERPRRVKFAGVSSALKVFENLFVDGAEGVAVISVVEVDLVDLVDHLPHQRAGFHEIVGVLEDVANDLCAFADVADRRQITLQSGEKLKVHKIEQPIARHSLPIDSPVAPAQVFRNRRHIVVADQFELGFAVVVDLEEEQPDHLADTLGVPIDTRVLAHDVLDGFDRAGNVTHSLEARG